MRATEIMTEDPMTVEVTAKIAEAIDILQTLEIRHLPVVDRGGTLVGMISDRDLRSANGKEESIAAIMSADVSTIDPETDVEEIIDLLLELKVGALPVVDEETKELMGIVSYVDVLRALRSAA